jgi:hypothetical protein
VLIGVLIGGRKVSSRRSGLKAIAPVPICEQQIGQMRVQKWPARREKEQKKKKQPTIAGAVFHSVRKHSDYLGYRAGVPGTGSTSSMPILIGAVLIAVAILLSTLVTALGTRYVGIEGPTEESAWLVDRLTGSVYRCQAPERGKATCEAETATGSIAGRQKQGR